jgi:DNA-binding CsgD family transcriptional regulator
MQKRGRRRYPDILTPREFEVLALIRERLTNERIAGCLGISADTAKQGQPISIRRDPLLQRMRS